MNSIRHRVGVKARLQDAFDAVHQPAGLQSWWAAAASGTATVGSRIELEFPGYLNHVWEITELVANKLVQLKLISGPEAWWGSEICFEFGESSEQVFITMIHLTSPETPEEAFQYFCTKWPTFLVSLKQYLETGTGMPYPNDLKIQHEE